MKDSTLPYTPTDLALLNQRSYFFDNGIYFECQQCGNCCTGAPGIVRISDTEISAAADFLKTTINNFKTDCLYQYKGEYAIREHEDGRCLFYENRCRIYPVRPLQCKAFPFWLKVFRSEESFYRFKKECPGIGQGKLYSKSDILELMLVF